MADEKESPYEDLQDEFETKARGLGKGKYGRIIKMARTPTREEYKKTLAITSIGVVLLGALGFLIMWLMTYLPTYF